MLAFLYNCLDILLQGQNVAQHLLNPKVVDSPQMPCIRDEEALHEVAQTVENEAGAEHEHLVAPLLTPCEHMFCAACVVPWVQSNETCPACRMAIDTLDLSTVPLPLRRIIDTVHQSLLTR